MRQGLPESVALFLTNRILAGERRFANYYVTAGLDTKPFTDRFGSCSGIF
jgi:hypothetical protein